MSPNDGHLQPDLSADQELERRWVWLMLLKTPPRCRRLRRQHVNRHHQVCPLVARGARRVLIVNNAIEWPHSSIESHRTRRLVRECLRADPPPAVLPAHPHLSALLDALRKQV
jgi:hypothetical protein